MPGSRSPNSTTPPLWSASSAASRSPIPARRRAGRRRRRWPPRARTRRRRAPTRTLTRVGWRACARCGPPRRAPTGPAARARRDVALAARLERHPEVRVHARQPLDLGHERRLRRARRAPERSLERGAQIAERRLRLGGAALARAAAGRSPSPSSAIETPNSRWITPSWISRARSIRCSSWLRLLRLRGHDPRHRGERRRLAERPQQIALGVIERRARQQPVGEDHPDIAAGGRHRRAHEPHRLGEQRRVLRRDLSADVAHDLDHPVLAQRPRRDRRRLDRHVRVREPLEVQPCAPAARTRRLAGS